MAFLQQAPKIDGVLDASLETLAVRTLALQSASTDASAVRAPTYRLAYGAEFLYVFVEIDAASLVQRDRAYQNGDGVVLVVAAPNPDGSSTREFAVLGFSPGVPAARWQQRFFWYRNVDLEMRPLDDTVVATASTNGRSSFEILVPWREVYPHHPWLSAGVGFNICVTRALEGTDRARYCAVEDNRVDSEQNPRRYVRLPFASAQVTGSPAQAAVALDRNWFAEGAVPHLRLATLAPAAGKMTLTLRVATGEGTRIASRQQTIDVDAGQHVQEVEVPAAALPAGGYTLSWDLGEGAASGRLGMTVLPNVDPAALTSRLDKAKARIAVGSYNTLRFRIEDLDRQWKALYPTDTAAALRVALDRTSSAVRDAESGIDTVAAGRGSLRRAYRSSIDGRLQPYSVKVPADYDANRRYPLLVFLHGSGQDDRGELNRSWLPQDFILIAPNGRGTSNWYTADHAQDDIREAVVDVASNYSVDPSRIVLAGFSMGGYGVYRTYKEDPKRYRALAIFSGIPRVPGSDGEAPDFLGKEDLKLFRDVPMFVFHGGKDRNCPIEQTRALVERLRQAGAVLQFEYEEDAGHETAGEATLRAFDQWVHKVVATASVSTSRR